MRSKYWFYSWKGGYTQVLALAEALDGRIIKRENSNYAFKEGDVVVNWGSSIIPPPLVGIDVLNQFSKVGHGKLQNWQDLRDKGIQVPEWTLFKDTAQAWNCRVVARNQDHGMGGLGITVYQKGDILGDHKFYVKYVKKGREFRFHVFKGKVIFVQEKLRKRDTLNVDKYVRSHGRGWCFAFKHLPDNSPPTSGNELAIQSVATLNLDFGAVDMGWNNGSAYTVFEVNSAPGIENTSLAAYVEAFRNV